jgi:hypothetical protein
MITISCQGQYDSPNDIQYLDVKNGDKKSNNEDQFYVSRNR